MTSVALAQIRAEHEVNVKEPPLQRGSIGKCFNIRGEDMLPCIDNPGKQSRTRFHLNSIDRQHGEMKKKKKQKKYETLKHSATIWQP